MKNFLFKILIIFTVISCKKNRDLRDHGYQKEFQDSALNVIKQSEIDSHLSEKEKKEDSIKSIDLELEFQRLLNAKPGETLVAQENSQELNKYIKKRLGYKDLKYEAEINNIDFEFSEKYRKLAFQKSREFIAHQIFKKNCNLLKQTFYNPSLVAFIGGSTYSIHTGAKFFCGEKNYREAYDINATYLGKEKWDMKITNEKILTEY